MAKDTPIEFTVGDREDIVETKVLVTEIHKKLNGLSCVQKPPVCPKGLDEDIGEVRREIKGLRKAAWGVVAGIIVIVVGGLILWGVQSTVKASLNKTQPQVEVQIDER